MKLQRPLGALCAGLMLLTLPVRAAEQSSYVTPVVGPMNMATFAGTYLNPALRAIVSCHNGTLAPANGPSGAPLAYQCWVDTTANPSLYNIYDGASWITLGSINTSTHAWIPFLTGDTVVGRATTDTLTNKTFDTAGAGNSFSINGLAATANTGTGSIVRATSPALITPALGTPSSGVATNLTGTASGLTAGNVTTNANMTGDVTSVGNATTLAAGNAGNLNSGTLLAARMPAHTGDVTTSAGSIATTIAANAVTNAKMATMAANTIKANATGSSAVPTDVSIPALTQKASPVAADKIMIADSAASDALKYATVSSIASAGSVGSFNGRTGSVVPTAGDYTYSANTIALPSKYWSGLAHSNNVTTPNTKIDITAGLSRDSTDAINISNSAGTIDCGTVGANGLDAGALANTTWYYTFAITTAGGTTAFLASTSPTAPTLPATYTLFRRIGSFRTDGSAHILAFKQVNDEWWWTVSIKDVNGSAVNTTPALYTLSVPRVQGVTAIFNVFYSQSTTASSGVTFRPGFSPAVSNSQDGYSIIQNVTGLGASGQFRIQVDSSGRVSGVGDQAANGTANIWTNGWRDLL